jgi:autotransporter-associated beta strand protein
MPFRPATSIFRVHLLLLLMGGGLSLPQIGAQSITLDNEIQILASLSNTTATLTGRAELRLTGGGTPLANSTVHLNSPDAWLRFAAIKPSAVNSPAYLGQIRVNGANAALNTNCRIVAYGDGAVVIPHGAGFAPLEVFTGRHFTGNSMSLGTYTAYDNSSLGTFNDKIRSFRLKRGYTCTVAQNPAGTGASRNYVAQDGDIEVAVLPGGLDNSISFVRVFPWRWSNKKGIAGNIESGLNVQWVYNWNLDRNSSLDLEYVPIRQQRWWPSLTQNWQSRGANHLLGYNEPDQPEQANLSVGDAISSWPDLLATGLRVGAPAVSDGGLPWLYDFIDQADAAGLRVDFVPVHYYRCRTPSDAAGAASQMYDFLKGIHDRTGRPIWITEWNNGANWTGCGDPTFTQQAAAVQEMMDMLDSTPFVERYALYNWVEDVRRVKWDDGSLTTAGVVYRDKVSSLSHRQAIPEVPTAAAAFHRFENNTRDSSPNGHAAIPMGAATFTTGRTGGQALSLSGNASRADHLLLSPRIGDSADFTFSAWVYWNGGDNWQRILDLGADTNRYLFLTPKSGSGTLRFAIRNGGAEQQLNHTGALPVNTWTHVGVTLSGNTGKLFVNGTLVATNNSMSINPQDIGTIENYLGKSRFTADPFFAGRLDDVQFLTHSVADSKITNTPPVFSGETVSLGNHAVGTPITGTIVGTATDPDAGDTITYGKLEGPAWLGIAANGALSGTPALAEEGLHTFLVQATDSAGASSIARFTIALSHSGTWISDSNGNWSESNRWSGGLPAHGSGSLADFSTLNLTADRSVTLDGSRVIGALRFGDSSGSQSWTLGASTGSTLTLSRASKPSIITYQNTATITAPLAGTDGFTKSGPGTLVLAGNNPLSGTVNIDSGSNSADDGVTRLVHPDAARQVSAFTIAANNSGRSTLELDGTAGAITSPAAITLSGRNHGIPALIHRAGNGNLTGGATLQVGGTNYRFQSDSGTLTLGGTITSAATGTRTLTFLGDGDHRLSGAVQNGSATVALSKNGGGTLTLAGSNTFTGAVNVTGGTLYANTANAANNRALSQVSGITVHAGATLRASANALFGWDGSQEKPITVHAGGILTTNGGLTSDVGVGLVTLNGGTLASLTGGATDWGSWRFDNPTDKLLVTENSTASATHVKFGNQSAAIEVASGKTLDFTGTITDASSGGISYLTKTGPGTLVLSGSNTHTGSTTVSGGALVVNGSVAPGSALTTANATELRGTGTIHGPATVNGIHSPGNSVGTQPFGSNLAYGATSRLRWELASNSAAEGSGDRVSANGSVTIANGASMDIVLTGSVALNDAFWTQPHEWTLVTGASVSGTFSLETVTNDPAGRALAQYGAFALHHGSTAVTLAYTPFGSLSPPTGLTVTRDNNQVSLSWTASAGAESYVILRALSSGGPYTAIAEGVTATNYLDATAINGTTYHYAVSSANSSAVGVPSGEVSATPFHPLQPYPADANTLVLFHFDETAGTSVTANAGSLGGNAYSVNMTGAAEVPPPVTSVYGASGTASLGNAAAFAPGQLLGWDANGSGGYQGDTGPILSADRIPMSTFGFGKGGGTPWSIEAMIRCNLAYSALTVNQQILCTDSSATSRGFQFRLNSSRKLELNLIATGPAIATDIPTTGPHAYETGAWYHVAATYDGSNIRLFWTRADSGATSANVISTTPATVGPAFGAVTGPLCIGGENRGANGESFRGSIDEVRISDIARVPTALQPAYLDTDNDTLPDEWERLHLQGLASGSDDDPDEDGYDNSVELAAGTHPDDDSDHPGLIDTDGDGLPDGWELARFGNLGAGPYQDPDLDGFHNQSEMVAGTDPLDDASVPGWQSPRVTPLHDSVVATDACLMPNSAPYGRALNGVSFQDGILLTFNGRQYTAWYDTVGNIQSVWLARRTVNGHSHGPWEAFNTGSTFINGKSVWNGHNVISLGICPADGTLHMTWDHHGHTLRYRRSAAGLCTTHPTMWGTSETLGPEQNWLTTPGSAVTVLTYPQFVMTPSGNLVLNYRFGGSGDGDQILRTYIPIGETNGGTWSNPIQFISRIGTYQGSTSRCPYINGLDFAPDGTLHATWTWREGPSTSNHDICHAFSQDGGITWRDTLGNLVANTTLGQSIRVDTPGITIKPLDVNQLLINQQSQCVDQDGRLHVLAFHRREEPEYAYPNVTTAAYSTRGTAYYHYFRDPTTGRWQQRRLPPDAHPVGARPKIAADALGNLYAAYVSYQTTADLTGGRGSGKLVIASTSRASQYTDWEVVRVIDTDANGQPLPWLFTGEPLLDESRLLEHGVLSVFIQEHGPDSSSALGTPLHVQDFAVISPADMWRIGRFGDAWDNETVAGDLADPDGDGVKNLLERAFGGNPLLSDVSQMPALDTTSPLAMTYRKSKSAVDLVFRVEESANLTDWSPASGSGTLIGDDGEVETIRFTTLPGSAGTRFIRLSITSP